MKRLLLVPLLLVALGLGGCATVQSLVGAGQAILEGGVFTTSIANPIGRRELAGIENAYGIALSGAVNYRRLPLCRTGQVETVSNACARRAVIVQLQVVDRKVRVALLNLRKFVRNNDTINAASAYAAAMTAINDFRAVAATNGVM